jgi:hypothetical protein
MAPWIFDTVATGLCFLWVAAVVNILHDEKLALRDEERSAWL